MRVNNINLKPIGKFVKIAGRAVVYGTLFGVCSKTQDVSEKHNNLTATYSGAVKAIMNSDMLMSDKSDTIAVLVRNESSEFYKAIIHVANDDRMNSRYKTKTINQLCGKNE